MRILEIAPPWFSIPPAGYGGIEWIVALLADGLVEAGHDVTLLASGGSVTLARLEPVYDAPPSLRIGDPWYETRHVVAGYLRRHDFDLVHDHTGTVGPALGALLDGPPVVNTLHGPWTEEVGALHALLAPRLHLVAISHDQARRAPAEVTVSGVVPNGIPIDSFPVRRERRGANGYLIDEVGVEELPDGAGATAQSDILAVGGRARLLQHRGGVAGEEVEGRVGQGEGGPLVVGHDEDRSVERRLLTPPALPLVVGPGSALRAELVAAHDLGANVAGEVSGQVVVQAAAASWVGAVGPARGRAGPGEEGCGVGVAKGAFEAPSLTGAVAVAGNVEVLDSDHLRHGCCSLGGAVGRRVRPCRRIKLIAICQESRLSVTRRPLRDLDRSSPSDLADPRTGTGGVEPTVVQSDDVDGCLARRVGNVAIDVAT